MVGEPSVGQRNIIMIRGKKVIKGRMMKVQLLVAGTIILIVGIEVQGGEAGPNQIATKTGEKING